MKIRLLFVILICSVLTVAVSTVQAQDEGPKVQEFYSRVSPDNAVVYFDLFGMEEDTTIYLYAESDEIDTYLILCDIDCEEVYAENDDIDFDGGNYNSALEFTFDEDGDYSIAILDCCDEEQDGIFRVLIGYNAPGVLDGSAVPNGAKIAIPYEPTFVNVNEDNDVNDGDESGVQQFIGKIDADEPFAYYDIFGANAGDTLYIYAGSSEIDPYLIVCDINCEEVYDENDDIDLEGGNFNSALEFTFPDDGDYSIAITDCCDDEAAGSFRVLLSYDDEDVLVGDAVPTGADIAEEYVPIRGEVADLDRTGSVECEDIVFGERPDLTGQALTAESDNFVVHYTTQGSDGATESYANDVLIHLEATLEQQLAMGWALPPQDCGEGGDERFDLYISDVLGNEGILGSASPEQIIGDNPNSEAVEEWAAYGYMTIDNDYKGTNAPLVTMRATVDHEFNHAIQFGYDVNDAAGWLYEATASWIETVVNTDDEDAAGYAVSLFDVPDLCMGSYDDPDELRVYGEWLLIDSIAQDFGNESIVDLWEFLAQYEDNDAYYRFLESLGTTPQDVLRRHAVRNLTLDYRLAPEFGGTVAVEANLNDTGTVEPRRNGVQQLGVDYVLIRQKGIYELSIEPSNLHLIMVGIDQRADTATVFDLGDNGVVDTTGFDYSYIIIMNTDENADSFSCDYTEWELSVEDGSGQSVTDANGEVFDASNFVPAG